jgi:hypothetical protein
MPDVDCRSLADRFWFAYDRAISAFGRPALIISYVDGRLSWTARQSLPNLSSTADCEILLFSLYDHLSDRNSACSGTLASGSTSVGTLVAEGTAKVAKATTEEVSSDDGHDE